jgi:N6-L-threonylcarbamoyladenine synthase
VKELILAIESSCDETALALVSDTGQVLVQELATQMQTHNRFGGVVPEVASREHSTTLPLLYNQIRQSPHFDESRLSAVASTAGPGLIGPLVVGTSFAQGLAMGWNIPWIGVHHLRGHLASVLLGHEDSLTLNARAAETFPALVLLVSGGHTQCLLVEPDLSCRKVIDTVDDAAGECFDKTAKLMGLGYPGGVAIEREAQTITSAQLIEAQKLAADLPRPKTAKGDFSFSGLKTAIKLSFDRQGEQVGRAVFAWAVQAAIADTLVQGLTRSLLNIQKPVSRLIVCGGVSANQFLRSKLQDFCQQRALTLVLPPLKYCTDNAAMIGAAAWVQDPKWALKDVVARVQLEAALT